MENQFELLDAAIAVTQAVEGLEVDVCFKGGDIEEMILFYNHGRYSIKSIEDLDAFIERVYHA